ncbi:phosphodiester glycosidase family protein [Luteolibacter yonseiensis]|nr:phosphodiester glycosidase family protein [Luteolibacter yonseiensis]
MRFFIWPAAFLSLTACFPAKPPAVKPSAPGAAVAKPQVAAASLPPPSVLPPPRPASPVTPPRVTIREISGITFEGVSFDSRSHRLRVVDQPGGPTSRFADSSSAAKANGGIAAVNAGFFTPEGAPLGLVVSDGKISGSWNTSSLGSGVWYEAPGGGNAITRRETLGRPGAAAMSGLLQAGPLLIENHRPVSGLEATKPSVRMLILWDGGTGWWIGRGSTCTLAQLGSALAGGSPAGWPIRSALNLDGGRSSDLWISESVSGGPLLRRSPWNRPVRNFLVLVPR